MEYKLKIVKLKTLQLKKKKKEKINLLFAYIV